MDLTRLATGIYLLRLVHPAGPITTALVRH